MAQLGRALPWGGRGRGFKSRRSDQLRYFKALGVIRVLSNSSVFLLSNFLHLRNRAAGAGTIADGNFYVQFLLTNAKP